MTSRKALLRYGSGPYCKEKLVAELGSAFLCGYAGIGERTIDSSAAYLVREYRLAAKLAGNVADSFAAAPVVNVAAREWQMLFQFGFLTANSVPPSNSRPARQS